MLVEANRFIIDCVGSDRPYPGDFGSGKASSHGIGQQGGSQLCPLKRCVYGEASDEQQGNLIRLSSPESGTR